MIKFSSLLLLGLFLTQLTDPVLAQDALRGDISNGRAIVDQYCARCHNVASQGVSPFQPAPPFRELASRWPLEYLEESLAEGISVGHKAMPEFQLSPDQIKDLLNYIRAISP
ncbi:MAG: cytochrome c [Pseudomonas marincola]